jgi:hypothetical protein
MKKTLEYVIKNNLFGLYYGNRVILPFGGNVLKIIINNDILLDFSPSSKDVFIRETGDYLEIYFKDVEKLSNEISKYECIKLVIVENDTDIFNFDNHKKIALHLEENHKLRIELIEDDILFIE